MARRGPNQTHRHQSSCLSVKIPRGLASHFCLFSSSFFFFNASVQFNSSGLDELGKAHVRSTPASPNFSRCLRSCLSVGGGGGGFFFFFLKAETFELDGCLVEGRREGGFVRCCPFARCKAETFEFW